ncbi:uncharacterized protein LOC112034969 [Quercus suber]|uniref:uncharacterized protein LOC112034969 n=1 Tax=Quercus suber TaxID=58331 RepID=UPI000CE219C9|nr:uncharacterized protein LOC112034969 [Quercus suber]
MSRALRRAVRSPFSADIERAPMPDRFTRPPFSSYDEKTDPVEHVSHYIQMMSLHSHNDALMCKVFSSSLGPTALRWFNRLRKGFVHSFAELIQEFGIRFVMCSRVPQPVDTLLSMKMRIGETLRSYASRYWELYNEIGEGNEKIAISTFRMGLPKESGLRESLTKKPPEDMRQLMTHIEKYKRLEDDWMQSKDKGHTTEQCRVLKDHLGQLAKAGYIKEFVLGEEDRGTGQGAAKRGNPLPPLLGVIEVIHAPPRSLASVTRKGVLNVVTKERSSDAPPAGKKIKLAQEPISFGDNDLEGTAQLHDDALVVTARVGGFLVKRMMIDQGSGADVMYPDLYRGLGLKSGDVSKYNTPLVEFDGKVVIPEGQISMPVNMEGKEVMVTFIVVTSFSQYIAILGRPWIHAMGAMPSILHVKVKFPTEHGIVVVKGSQQTTRQYLIAMVNQRKEGTDQGGYDQQKGPPQGGPL